jgi:hypothetical protein
MLLFRVLLVFSVVGKIASSDVTCHKTQKRHRKQYREVLRKNGVVFMAVAYSYYEDQENVTVDSRIKIHFKTNDLRMPMALLQYHPEISSGNCTYIIHAKLTTIARHDYLQFLHSQADVSSKSKCLTDGNKMQIYAFQRQNSSENNELMLFHACRMQMDINGKIQVEKSLLFLIGKDTHIDENIWENIIRNSNMTAFKLGEFKDQDFCLCERMKFYINECQYENEKESNSLLTIVLVFLIGLTIVIMMMLYNGIMMSSNS